MRIEIFLLAVVIVVALFIAYYVGFRAGRLETACDCARLMMDPDFSEEMDKIRMYGSDGAGDDKRKTDAEID